MALTHNFHNSKGIYWLHFKSRLPAARATNQKTLIRRICLGWISLRTRRRLAHISLPATSSSWSLSSCGVRLLTATFFKIEFFSGILHRAPLPCCLPRLVTVHFSLCCCCFVLCLLPCSHLVLNFLLLCLPFPFFLGKANFVPKFGAHVNLCSCLDSTWRSAGGSKDVSLGRGGRGRQSLADWQSSWHNGKIKVTCAFL